MNIEIELSNGNGKRKVARVINIVLQPENNNININYQELVLLTDGKIESKSEGKTITIMDEKAVIHPIQVIIHKSNPNNTKKKKYADIPVMETHEKKIKEESLKFTEWFNQYCSNISEGIITKMKEAYNIK